MDLAERTVDYQLPHFLQYVEAQNNLLRQQQHSVGVMEPAQYDPNHPDTIEMYKHGNGQGTPTEVPN